MKFKQLFYVICIFCYVLNVEGQKDLLISSRDWNVDLFLVEKEGKLGVMDCEGVFILKPVWDDIHLTSYFLKVKKDERVEWYDLEGKKIELLDGGQVLECIKQNGVLECLVIKDDQYYFVKSDGSYFELKGKQDKIFYEEETDYHIFYEGEGLSRRKGLINAIGKQIEPAIYNDFSPINETSFVTKVNDKIGYIDLANNYRIPIAFFKLIIDIPNQVIRVNDGSKWGIYSQKNGNLLLPLVVDEIEVFIDGKAVFKKNNKYGCVNTIGDFIIEAQYDSLYPFINGLALGLKDKQWQIIDTNNNILKTFTENVEPQFKYNYLDLCFWEEDPFFPKYLAIEPVQGKTSQLAYVNSASNSCVQAEYSKVSQVIKLEEKYYIINKYFKEGVAFDNLPSLCGIDENGSMIYSFYDTNKQQYGFYFEGGNTIAPYFFSKISYRNSVLKVLHKNEWKKVHLNANSYELLTLPKSMMNLKKGDVLAGKQIYSKLTSTTYKFKENDRYGLIDTGGVVLYPAIYNEIQSWENSDDFYLDEKQVYFLLKSINKFVLIDNNLETIYESKFKPYIPCHKNKSESSRERKLVSVFIKDKSGNISLAKLGKKKQTYKKLGKIKIVELLNARNGIAPPLIEEKYDIIEQPKDLKNLIRKRKAENLYRG